MGPQELGKRAMELAGITAEIVLKRVGTVLPFAIGLAPTGEKTAYTMKGGSGDASQFQDQVLAAVKADVNAGKIAVVAFAGPVDVTHPVSGRMVKAICVQVELKGQAPVVAFRSYKKGFFGMKIADLPPTKEPAPFERVFN